MEIEETGPREHDFLSIFHRLAGHWQKVTHVHASMARCAVARGASPTEKATMCSLPSWIAWPLPSNAFLRLHFPPRLFFLQREAVLTVAVLKDWRRSVNRNGSKVWAGIYFFVRFYVKHVNIDSKLYDFFLSFLFVSIFCDRKKNYRIVTILLILIWNFLDIKILDNIINFFLFVTAPIIMISIHNIIEDDFFPFND